MFWIFVAGDNIGIYGRVTHIIQKTIVHALAQKNCTNRLKLEIRLLYNFSCPINFRNSQFENMITICLLRRSLKEEHDA